MSSDTHHDDPEEERTQPTATRSGRTSREPSSDLEEETVVVQTEPAIETTSDVDADRTEAIVAAVPEDLTPSARIVPSSSLCPMLLERIEPSLGRGERVRLDASHWKMSLGRAEESDVRLYTASASRDHATISGNTDGDWVLALAAGKSVLIDGEMTTEPVILEAGMNIILGQDHLRCVTEGLGRREMPTETAADAIKDSADSRFRGFLHWVGQRRAGRWAIAVIAAIAVGVILFGLLGR